MVDASVTEQLRQQLFKLLIQVLHYVSQHHMRILSCEMEWIRNEQSGLVYLSDIKKMVVSKTGNKPFTNSLFRHMKRNLVAILDEEAKEIHALKIKGQKEFLALTYGGGKSSLMLPPRHRFAGPAIQNTERQTGRQRLRSVALAIN